MKKTSIIISVFFLSLILAGCMGSASGSGEQELKPGTDKDESAGEQKASSEEARQKDPDPSSSDIEIIKDDRQGITPVTIEIPSIDVKAEVEHVGTLENGQMDVPKDSDNVGWYKPGAMPGEPGNAVLAGHVDDLTSPAVFYNLHKLKEGDQIHITDADGKTLTFEVYGSEVYPRTDSPIENIFGFTYRSVVNLITCTGDFDEAYNGREDRLVVSAELVKVEE